MTALGISLIAIGVALVCAGVVFWPRAPRTDPGVHDSPDKFRTILDALNEEDRRDENRDLDETPAKEPPTDSGAGATTQPGKQRLPQLGLISSRAARSRHADGTI
jgi:hypothetical protein